MMLKNTYSSGNSIFFISILCIVSNFSYYPTFVENGLGRIVTISLWVLFIGVTIIRGKLFVPGNQIFKIFSILFGMYIVNALIASLFNQEIIFENHFFMPVMVAYLILILANTLGDEWGKEKLAKIATVYMYSMLVLSILAFVFYLKGTDLSSAIYTYKYGKNEISVLLLCALIIACTVYKPKKASMYIWQILTIFFCTVDILFLRCRSVMIGIVVLIVVVIFPAKRINLKVRMLIILALIGIVIYFIKNPNQLTYFLDNIVFAGRESDDLNDISSGRGNQISLGLEAFRNHLILGEGNRRTIDCFYISVLANYGILGWPLIVMAVMPVIWSIYNLKNGNEIDVCFFVIAVSLFIVSLMEELAPFGSGTRCYLLWLMWGILLQDKKRQRIADNSNNKQNGFWYTKRPDI